MKTQYITLSIAWRFLGKCSICNADRRHVILCLGPCNTIHSRAIGISHTSPYFKLKSEICHSTNPGPGRLKTNESPISKTKFEIFFCERIFTKNFTKIFVHFLLSIKDLESESEILPVNHLKIGLVGISINSIHLN